jgi:hypothetical protein
MIFMKSFLVALAVVVFLPAITFSQQKHENAIVVSHLSFREAMMTCMNSGYTIAVKDDSLKFFSTTLRANKHGDEIVLHLRIKDSVAVITGDFNSNITLDLGGVSAKMGITQIEFRGMRGSAYGQSWNSMDDFAKLFGKPISYAKL